MSQLPKQHVFGGLAAVVLAALLSFPACGGTVRTLDGKSLVGTVTFGTQGDLVVKNPAGAETHVDLHDLLDVSLGERFDPAVLQPGLLLANGDAITGLISKADDSTITYSHRGAKVTVDIGKVADMVFHPLPGALRNKISSDSTGALLSTGDFIEGDFVSIVDGKVRISSVIIGNVDLPIDWRVMLVRLRPARVAASNWVVRLMDGSTLHANKIEIANNKLTVTGDDGHGLAVLVADVGQIEVGAAHMNSLNGDRAAIEPNDPARLLVDLGPGRLSPQLLGASVQHGLWVAANTSITYDLDEHARTLVARVGVPQAMQPTAKVRFIVLVDGKVVAQTPFHTSLDDSSMLAVKVAGGKKLTLRVESASEAQTGGWGLWGDAAIVNDQP